MWQNQRSQKSLNPKKGNKRVIGVNNLFNLLNPYSIYNLVIIGIYSFTICVNAGMLSKLIWKGRAA